MKRFIIGIILSILFLLVPIALGYFGLIYRNKYMLIGAGAVILLYMTIRKPLANLVADGRQSVEYDEFGRSKRKGDFKKLSRAEQDAIDLQKTADMERLLSQSVINRIIKQGSKNPEKDLADMTGLAPVKNKVSEMAARMQFEKQNNKGKSRKNRINSMSGRHMVFYGSAGTGKTTVCRIIAGFLYKYGYIKKNKVVEVDGNFLKAGAETATKVKLITQYAYDGVLFIDEAYVLCEGAYGAEAVATLIKEMEDNRDRFICILAGYTQDMNRLLEFNSGFKSRIREYLNFPDYSIPEMQEIFCSMAHSQNFAVSGEALKMLEIRLEKERQLRTFGNGRTVRNVLDEAIDRHSLNIVSGKLPPSERFRICGDDISTAVQRNGIT